MRLGAGIEPAQDKIAARLPLGAPAIGRDCRRLEIAGHGAKTGLSRLRQGGLKPQESVGARRLALDAEAAVVERRAPGGELGQFGDHRRRHRHEALRRAEGDRLAVGDPHPRQGRLHGRPVGGRRIEIGDEATQHGAVSLPAGEPRIGLLRHDLREPAERTANTELAAQLRHRGGGAIGRQDFAGDRRRRDHRPGRRSDARPVFFPATPSTTRSARAATSRSIAGSRARLPAPQSKASGTKPQSQRAGSTFLPRSVPARSRHGLHPRGSPPFSQRLIRRSTDFESALPGRCGARSERPR
ncbi:hypothetical protein BTHI11S_05675 [Bosea thiooxidans]